MEAGTPNRQPLTGNRNALVAVVALVAIVAIGLVLFFVLHNSKGKSGTKSVIGIGPKAFKTASRLKLESISINTNFYWAGPQPGVRYGFQRTTDSNIFVRYLPKGMSVHDGSGVLTISTYPGNAYTALKKKITAIPRPNQGVMWIDPKHRTSVYLAWRNKNVEVEVFDPNPRKAKFTALSGRVQPIR